MYFLRNKLLTDLEKYEEIILWGAGDYAEKVYAWLSGGGLNRRISSFVVSGKREDRRRHGIPVIPIGSLHLRKENYVILIAVSKKYNEEIQRTAALLGYSRVIDINEYFAGLTKERELIRDASFDTFAEYMGDWAADSRYSGFQDYDQASHYLSDLVLHPKESDKNEIVFIVGQIFIRTTKISLALKKKGYRVKILQLDIGEYPGEGELIECGIELVKCECLAELFVRALEESPLVYYMDPPFQDATIAAFMIRNKKCFGKIIFGEYDIFKDFVDHPLPEYRYQAERYSMEQADGVVWRYDAKDYFEKKYGYSYQGKQIQFYDYCGDYVQRKRDEDCGTLRLCWLPTVLNIHLKKYEIDEKFTHFATVPEMIRLVENRDDCLLDIYTWNPSPGEMEILRGIEKKQENVKFYCHVAHSKLMELLQQYDYGCFLYRHENPPEYVEINDGCYITGEKAVYPVCNKFFDYIAAGIPVIADYPEKECDYLDQFGVMVKMDVNTFDIEYLKKNKQVFRERAARARQELLMDNQISRLIDFFTGEFDDGG